MKKGLITTIVVSFTLCLFVASVWAEDSPVKKDWGYCPKTKMDNSCFDCHIKPSFGLKEKAPDAHLSYPNSAMKIMGFDTGNLYGYFLLEDIESRQVKDFFDYLHSHNIKRAVIEINSPGGSLFGAQRIISFMESWISAGNELATRVDGFAASAGFLIFCAGEKGKRYISPTASLMWHELMTFKMFSIETPSDQEEQSRILRGLQDIRNNWLATRGKLTKDELDAKIKKKEFWMSGKEAVDYGYADGFIGKP